MSISAIAPVQLPPTPANSQQSPNQAPRPARPAGQPAASRPATGPPRANQGISSGPAGSQYFAQRPAVIASLVAQQSTAAAQAAPAMQQMPPFQQPAMPQQQNQFAQSPPVQQTVAQSQPPEITTELGLYRDGNNNLDAAEAPVIPGALAVSATHPNLHFTVEDTTSLGSGLLRTDTYTIYNGQRANWRVTGRRDMASRAEFANFVATVLDNSEKSDAKQSWIEIVDHGAGDAGGVFTMNPNGTVNHMTVDTLAGAITDGVAIHARRHPEDAGRRITGVLMHECFELTMGVAAMLSRAGVRFLAASSETTIAPGIPSITAGDIADNADNPQAMADAVVRRVMGTRYRQKNLVYGPAAAFDVLDISAAKMEPAIHAEREFNRLAIAAIHKHAATGARLLFDAAHVSGMQRDEPAALVPWRGDRPAIALYLYFAGDRELPLRLRRAALDAAQGIAGTVLAHGESRNAVGFGKDYRDAVGPTTRFPVRVDQIDPLSPPRSNISESALSYEYDSLKNTLISKLLLDQTPGTAAAAA